MRSATAGACASTGVSEVVVEGGGRRGRDFLEIVEGKVYFVVICVWQGC